ncbi:MAG: hypothetical protein ABI042_15885 [Verrucomicrobiota bacterium]
MKLLALLRLLLMISALAAGTSVTALAAHHTSQPISRAEKEDKDQVEDENEDEDDDEDEDEEDDDD